MFRNLANILFDVNLGLRETQISQYCRYAKISQLMETGQFCRYVGDTTGFSLVEMVVIFNGTCSLN
jgi:hypothetical protein